MRGKKPHNPGCEKCRYSGYAAGMICCDYCVMEGRSRSIALQIKAEDCELWKTNPKKTEGSGRHGKGIRAKSDAYHKKKNDADRTTEKMLFDAIMGREDTRNGK